MALAAAVLALALPAPHPDPAPVVEHPPAGIDCSYACVQRVKRNVRADLHRRHRARARMIASMPVATASWYFDAGQTASGRHYTYGFAALRYGNRWGLRVRFCYRMQCHIGRLQDHGPYIAGRTFDLNPALKAALGCGDLCAVHFRALP